MRRLESWMFDTIGAWIADPELLKVDPHSAAWSPGEAVDLDATFDTRGRAYRMRSRGRFALKESR